ncbi:hypothetical protein SDC9_197520 [bioreactor metagenome]|uniref:Uncharacterized protein n=1 Tax=bioreactor metagenome TaxID=1076179 RepID=A0A645IG09_9ZZZZ
MCALLDSFDIATNALTYLVLFRRYTFAVGQHGFVLPEIDKYVGSLETPYDSADNIPDAILEFRKDHRLFGAPDLHHQRLLGILSCNTAKSDRSYLNLEFFTDLGVRLDTPGFRQKNLVVFGNNLLGNNQLCIGTNIAVFGVNRDAQLAGRADRLLCGR